MGKRQFLYNIHYPITNEKELNYSYDITHYLLTKGTVHNQDIRNILTTISDLERFMRKMVSQKIAPKNLSSLVEDLTNIETLNTLNHQDELLSEYLSSRQLIGKDDYLKLKVTEAGKNVIHSDKSVELSILVDKKKTTPKKSAGKGKKSVVAAADESLVEKIRAFRKQLAQVNKVPAYVIFHDATLHELSDKKPKNKTELLDIQGMGNVKVERFGEDLLNIISNHKVDETESKKSTV